MNRSVAFPCVLLGLFLLAWTSLSVPVADKMRSWAVGFFTPAWRGAEEVKEYLSDRPIAGAKKRAPLEESMLQLENQRLKAQLELAKEWIYFEMKRQRDPKGVHFSGFLDLESKAIPAQVIYRDPSSWSSSLWVGVGEEDNRSVGRSIVARNSPVVDGRSLVGVIDYVGKRQSRVRLITDPSLTPSVRVVRTEQPEEIAPLIDALTDKLKERDDLFGFASQLQSLKEKLGKKEGEVFLAKGQLHGNGAPFWRSRDPILKGVGFNYDYCDSEGPARELKTGRPIVGADKPIPLILAGDRLVTSGLDGVFPKGISVAIATSVFPLEEGSYAYEIEARPTAQNLNDLKVVFVLPALSGE